MGVGAKMAKGAVVRSRSLLSGTWTRRTPRALLAGGGGCCFSPPDAPHGVRRIAASLPSPALARVWTGLRAPGPAPGEGREGRGCGEPVSLWGRGRGRGSVAGVRCQANNLVYSWLRPLRGWLRAESWPVSTLSGLREALVARSQWGSSTASPGLCAGWKQRRRILLRFCSPSFGEAGEGGGEEPCPLLAALLSPLTVPAQGTRGVLGQRSGYRCLLVSRGPCDGCSPEQTVWIEDLKRCVCVLYLCLCCCKMLQLSVFIFLILFVVVFLEWYQFSSQFN